MFGVIVCILSLAAANFGYQAFKDVPVYMDAIHATWSQTMGILIYYFIWAKKD